MILLGLIVTLFFSTWLLSEKKDSMLTYLRSIGLLVLTEGAIED